MQARIFRANHYEERLQEFIQSGTILIDTSGSHVGQINGLSVLQLGDHSFGRPSRVTVTTSMGTSGIVNIEREAKLSGSTHDKGVLILSGYLRQMYAQDKPLTLSASLCFEQSYGGIDGDSASSTELYALLSRLADLPLRQDLAVTGSVNQRGEVQAIGGVNEKSKAFSTCVPTRSDRSARRLIPQANVHNLDAAPGCGRGDPRRALPCYPVTHLDQGLALLTGVPAGDYDRRDGALPGQCPLAKAGTGHRRVWPCGAQWYEAASDGSKEQRERARNTRQAGSGRARTRPAGGQRCR